LLIWIQFQGSIWSGTKQGVVSVAQDCRDTSVERARHREGEAAAKRTYDRYEVAGNIAVSGGNVLSVYNLTTARGAVEVSTRIGAGIGKGVSNYEAHKNNVFFGGKNLFRFDLI
jgi:hypothetical protein